ncbi:MAG TPA: hypothetical protein VIU85_06355, partial [Chthoniobacterales bacterium]
DVGADAEGDAVAVSIGDGEGDSCASNVVVAPRLITKMSLRLFVISSGVETSLDISEQCKARQ